MERFGLLDSIAALTRDAQDTRRCLHDFDHQQTGLGHGSAAAVNRLRDEFTIGFEKWLRHLDGKGGCTTDAPSVAYKVSAAAVIAPRFRSLRRCELVPLTGYATLHLGGRGL